MSTVSVGRRYENYVKEIYKTNGWLVDKKVRTRFSSPDFFGEFDLLCIKGDLVDFVQVKKNKSDYYTAKRKIKEWCFENKLDLRGIYIYNHRGSDINKGIKQRIWKIAELVGLEWVEITLFEDDILI